MKKLAPALVLALSLPASVLAQKSDSSVHGEFYAFTAPIVSNTQYYFNRTAVGGNNTGFGLDVLLRHGLGFETEASYAGPDWSFSGNSAVRVVSFDASYHFLGSRSRKKLDPFVAGGLSLYFGQPSTFRRGYNLGGGTNYWVLKHLALRTEVRFQGGTDIFAGFSQFTHYAAFRFGITIR